MRAVHLGVVFALLHLLHHGIIEPGLNDNSDFSYSLYSLNTFQVPTAVNDTFILAIGCGNHTLTGNIMDNDNFDSGRTWVSEISYPQSGNFSCDPNGNFYFSTEHEFRGELTINYRISAIEDPGSYSEAQLVIYVADDYDCDNVINSIDIDDDNDGILDVHEGETEDTDGDGIPNCHDIDSDNDGITDFTEWQTEDSRITLLLNDDNGNGWDNAFDPENGGDYYRQVDTDQDGTPDFLDTDSDNDGISDFIEAFDINNNQNPKIKLLHMDLDHDGLDKCCDTINNEISRLNPMGSCSPLPDHNNNGIRDWRDENSFEVEIAEQYTKNTEIIGENPKLLVYPNPVVHNCRIIIPDIEEVDIKPYSLKIYDTGGKLAHLELLNKKESMVQLDHLRAGLYFVQIKVASTNFTTKLIKSE